MTDSILARLRNLDVDEYESAKPAPTKTPDSKKRSAGLGPSLVEGRIRYLSPSQLEKFDFEVFGGCERKWWFRYIAGKSEPQRGSQKLGEQVHAQIEHYLKTGEDVLGEIARAGKRFLPRPGPDLMVEYAFGAPEWPGPVEAPVVSPLTAAGVPVIGFSDLMHTRGEWVADDGTVEAERVPGDPENPIPADGVVLSSEVVDWKTTAQIEDEFDDETGERKKRGYAKTAEELAATWQMVGYGELARRMWPGLQVVRLSHGYFQTRGPRAARKRSLALPVGEVARRWRRADALVERMKAVAATARVEDVPEPPSYETCNAYGGCAFRSMCPRDPKRVLAEAIGGSRAMSLLAKLKGTTTPPVNPEIAAEKAKLEAEERAIRAAKSGILSPDSPPPSKIAEPIPEESSVKGPSCVACGSPSTRAISTAAGTQTFCGRCEPEQTAAPSNSPPPPAAAPPSTSSAACASGTTVELDTDTLVSKKYACACGETVKVKPQKLGDGKYYAAIPKHGIPATPAEKPKAPDEKVATFDAKTGEWKPTEGKKIEPAPEPEKKVEVFAGIEASSAGLVLYLDSIEDGVAAQRLEKYAEARAAELAAEFKAIDVRCAPADSALGFGKWKGALAAVVRSSPPAPGAYAVSSSNELGMVAFEALASTARVIRGVK